MRVVHPYSGPNSFDVRRDGDVVTVMVGCFERSTARNVAMGFYADLLDEFRGENHQLVVHIQSLWFQRLQDRRRARAIGVVSAGTRWLAVRLTPSHDMRKLLQEFWGDKELRFYSVPSSVSVNDLPLDRWYRTYLEEFGQEDFALTRFVAGEVWCDGYLVIRSSVLTEDGVREAITTAANRAQLEFVFNREPFLSQPGRAR